MMKILILAFILITLSYSTQQFMFQNTIGTTERRLNKNTAASRRKEFLLRQKEIEKLRKNQIEFKNKLMAKLEADRQKIILAYLQPHAGKTSILKDFQTSRY